MPLTKQHMTISQHASVILWHILCPLFILLNFVLWPLCLYRGWWAPLLGYAVWYAWSFNWPFDGSLRGWPWFRRFCRPWFQCYASWFPLTLEYTNLKRLQQQISNSKSVIFCSHPHGLLPSATMTCFTLEPSQFNRDLPMIDFHFITLDFAMMLPFIREFAMAFGFGGVSRPSVQSWLTPRDHQIPAIHITPGGAREVFYALPHTIYMIVENRMGFIKVAKEMGSLIVPVIAFGENEVAQQFETSGWIRKLQEWIVKNRGPAVPLLTSWLPRRVPMTLMVGEGITVGKDDDVTDIHRQYKEALQRMHAEATSKLGRPIPPLKFL